MDLGPARHAASLQATRRPALRALIIAAAVTALAAAGCAGSSQPVTSDTVDDTRVETDLQPAPRVGPPETTTPSPPVEDAPVETAPTRAAPPAEEPSPRPVAILPGPDSDMLVGFHDDRTFLYLDGRGASLEEAASLGTGIIRTYVVWGQVAPTRPANASNPNDPAYDWSFHDALVREAHARGVQILMTIWTTPAWANGEAGDSTAPTNLQDLVDFSFALARRYSGTFEDIPEVPLYSVWNEPNLNRFLSPQFDEHGRSVSPATYAAMYRAAHLGLKAANPTAQVAILEVSPRGRDRPGERPTRDSHSPGRFAELVAQACDGSCEFDAVAWHPYSPSLGGAPSSKVRWPNANLPELDRFSRSLADWFELEAPPRLWITEYGHQTNPPRDGAVTPDEQADYLEEALRTSHASGLVDLFIWFIYQDDPTSVPNRWEAAGGLIDRDAVPKPSFERLRETIEQLRVPS